MSRDGRSLSGLARPPTLKGVATSGSTPAVVVDGLTKNYGANTAVDKISFQVETGEVFALLGPNGAGKTSTLRLLLGLMRPTSGTATINGRVYAQLASPLREVGAVLESASFHPGRTARAHLRLQALAAGAARERADAVLDRVGLGGSAASPGRGQPRRRPRPGRAVPGGRAPTCPGPGASSRGGDRR